jgi:hypothetical protein
MVVARFVGVCGDGATLARPKSRILMRPSLVTNRFSGLRSRCAEGFSFQEFGYQVGRSLVSAHLKDRENVGMAQSGGGFGLDLEALQSIRFGGDKLGENFDGDVAIQPGIAGAVDLAHTAGAERCENFILAKLGARDQRHVRANYNVMGQREGGRDLTARECL